MKSWGGRRSGSGRKKEKTKALTIRVSEATADIIKKQSEELGISQGKVVDLMVRQYVESIEEGD